MEKTLKQRTMRSGSWVIFGHLFSQGLRLGSNLILTRLLVPEMFGVMAIVTVIMAGLTMFSDVGLLQNIVQSKRGEELVYLNTAWTIQIVRGCFIFLIAVAVSAGLYYFGQAGYLPVNTVYGNSDLPKILAIVSVTSIISGFNSIHILTLNRKLMMGKLTIINLISQFSGVLVMLIWVSYKANIWALVFGGLVGATVKMLISHRLESGIKCSFCWDKSAVNEIFHFGKWIFISSILGFLLNQGDKLLLALWVSPDVLGIYSIAFFLAMALKGILKKVISSVFYPMLSEVVRENPSALKSVYYTVRAKVDFITMLTAGAMASTGQHIINILYDDRYSDAGWMVEILSVSLVFIGYSMAGVCLMATGNVKSNTWLILCSVIFLYISMPVSYYFYGIYGAVVMVSINFIIDIPSTFYMLNKHGLLDIRKEFRMLPILILTYGICEYFSLLILDK